MIERRTLKMEKSASPTQKLCNNDELLTLKHPVPYCVQGGEKGEGMKAQEYGE